MHHLRPRHHHHHISHMFIIVLFLLIHRPHRHSITFVSVLVLRHLSSVSSCYFFLCLYISVSLPLLIICRLWVILLLFSFSLHLFFLSVLLLAIHWGDAGSRALQNCTTNSNPSHRHTSSFTFHTSFSRPLALMSSSYYSSSCFFSLLTFT